jgi:hypothetical protein
VSICHIIVLTSIPKHEDIVNLKYQVIVTNIEIFDEVDGYFNKLWKQDLSLRRSSVLSGMKVLANGQIFALSTRTQGSCATSYQATSHFT